MTAYRNFTDDFASRCLEVFNDMPPDLKEKRRVTLLMMIASSAFVLPFELLKPDTEYSSHPFRENVRQSAVANELKAVLDEKFASSRFVKASAAAWRFAKDVADVSGELDAWLPTVDLRPISRDKLVGSTLTHIRNSIAHGNVHVKGIPNITELILVREQKDHNNKRDGFSILTIPVGDFEFFVKSWILFLKSVNFEELRRAA